MGGTITKKELERPLIGLPVEERQRRIDAFLDLSELHRRQPIIEAVCDAVEGWLGENNRS